MAPLVQVDDTQVATIVTTLEMRKKPKAQPMPESRLELVHWPAPMATRYRTLFRRVGEPWLWFSRLAMDDETLNAIIHDPKIEVRAVTNRYGIELGMLELDFRKPGACELSYLGLVPELVGQGNGRWLMAHALGLAWRKGVDHVWVHTCTLDHPGALNFYIKSGFRPVSRAVETFADPRIDGTLAADAAPHVPLLAAARRR